MSQNRILIVDDDVELCELLIQYLGREGFSVEAVHEGVLGVDKALSGGHSLVVLDVMLPGISGLDVLRRIRASSEIPVVMLTARGEEVDRIVGLELGADDYVVKPFSPRELILRVRAILKRYMAEEAPATVWRLEGLSVDFQAHRVLVDDQEITLTATEFRLLGELIRNQGKVQSRDHLLDKVWGYQFEGYARTVDTHVRRLRQKLGPYAEFIETLRGVGYRFRD